MTCSNFKAVVRKFNHLRKQNWSAPASMSVVIIIFMFMIFCFENLGLLNKDKNLNIRFAPMIPENSSDKKIFHNLEIVQPESIQEAPKVGYEKTLYKKRVFRAKLSESSVVNNHANHKINKKKIYPLINELYPEKKEQVNQLKLSDIQIGNKKENVEILNNMLLDAVEEQIDYEAYGISNNQTFDSVNNQLGDQVEDHIKHNFYDSSDDSDDDLDDILNEIDISNGN